jgi:hypothetical protein
VQASGWRIFEYYQILLVFFVSFSYIF